MLLGRSGKFVSHRDLTEFFNTLLELMRVIGAGSCANPAQHVT